MHIRKKKKLIQDENKYTVDPRFLLEGDCLLWDNPSSEVSMRHPIVIGTINLPIRLLSCVYDYQKPIVVNGEECVRLQLSLWEADPRQYREGVKAPFYRGKIQVRADVIAGDVGERLKELINISFKNRTDADLNFLGEDAPTDE